MSIDDQQVPCSRTWLLRCWSRFDTFHCPEAPNTNNAGIDFSSFSSDLEIIIGKISSTFAWSLPSLTFLKVFFKSLFETLSTSYFKSSAFVVTTATACCVREFQQSQFDFSEGLDSLLAHIPLYVRSLIELSFTLCRDHVMSHKDWPESILVHMRRQDLLDTASTVSVRRHKQSSRQPSTTWSRCHVDGDDDGDGLVTAERSSHFRFSEDDRVHEVCVTLLFL